MSCWAFSVSLLFHYKFIFQQTQFSVLQFIELNLIFIAWEAVWRRGGRGITTTDDFNGISNYTTARSSTIYAVEFEL